MSEQPLNDAWGQGADGKWYPPEQLWGAASSPGSTGGSPWAAPPPVAPARPSRWPWLAVAAGGLATFLVLTIVGIVTAEQGRAAEATGRSAPTATSEPDPTTTSTTSTTASTTTTATTTTTVAPTTTAAPPPPPPPPTQPPPPPPTPPTTAAPPPPVHVAPPVEVGVHYENCAAARAAGAAPVHRGQPGYARHLDRDGDGIGCE